MTREEKLEAYLDHQYMFEYGSPDYIYGIRHGVEWADKNPKLTWISVEERLPEEHTDVIVTDGRNVAHCKKYGDGFYTNIGKCCNVTHWMPIPELPKKGE